MGRRCIGLDVHREFAQVAAWEDGPVRQAGQIALTDDGLRVFADSLGPTISSLPAPDNNSSTSSSGSFLRVSSGNPRRIPGGVAGVSPKGTPPAP